MATRSILLLLTVSLLTFGFNPSPSAASAIPAANSVQLTASAGDLVLAHRMNSNASSRCNHRTVNLGGGKVWRRGANADIGNVHRYAYRITEHDRHIFGFPIGRGTVIKRGHISC